MKGIQGVYGVQGITGPTVQSDWNQTNDTALDYIKNKPVVPEYTPITYQDLLTLKNNNNLNPGQYYRITDYVTTTKNGTNPDINTADYKSAGHAFDLIVIATSVSALDCEAMAVQHTGDTYFTDCDLFKWQIWYDINNDTNKYEWADATNGKGVIYRMIDEWGNDCPYDFKNIMFKRNLDNSGDTQWSGSSGVTATWVYTFSWFSQNRDITDCSIKGNTELLNDEGIVPGVCNNVIEPFAKHFDENNTDYPARKLNDIAFVSSYFYDAGFFYGFYNITIKNDGYNITGNSQCHDISIDSFCQNIRFERNNYNIDIGKCNEDLLIREGCYIITIGKNCVTVSIEDFAHNITIGNSFSSSTIGAVSHDITIGDGCNNCNTGSCANITIGNNCSYITLGTDIYNFIIGNGCSYIKTGTASSTISYVRNVTIEPGNNHIYINADDMLSSSNYLQNLYIAHGANDSSTWLDLIDYLDTANTSYRTTIARKIEDDNVIRYCEEHDTVARIDGKKIVITNDSYISTPSFYRYGVCSTLGSTAAKTVTISDITLYPGASIYVRFSNANTAANPTLNVSNTGAKPIKWDSGATPKGVIAAGGMYHLIYQITDPSTGAWHMAGQPGGAYIEPDSSNSTYPILTSSTANRSTAAVEYLQFDTVAKINHSTGVVTAGGFVKSGGSSLQFLKADGSVDNSQYTTVTFRQW